MTMSTVPHVKSESNLSDASGEVTVATEASDLSDSLKRVSFGSIEIREFVRVVGDHPDTRIGVPLALGWAFNEKDPVPIDAYEADRTSKGNLRMSSITRKNILHNVFDIPEEELRAAEKEVQKIRKSREHSNKQTKLGAKTESAFKAVRRRVRTLITAENFIKGLTVAASGGAALSMSR